MKNVNTVINIILGVAVIILFVLYLDLKNKTISDEVTTSVEEQINSSDLAKEEIVDSILSKRVLDFPIAYVNLDSLSENFIYYQQEVKKLTASIAKKRRQFENRQRNLQQEMIQTEEDIRSGKIVVNTNEELAAIQTKLQKKQENLVQASQNFEAGLAKSQQDLLVNTNASLKKFLEENKDKFKYSYVLPEGAAGAVLYANGNYDITAEVTAALNAEYADKIEKE